MALGKTNGVARRLSPGDWGHPGETGGGQGVLSLLTGFPACPAPTIIMTGVEALAGACARSG
ncbi:MAG: hypothetical protein H6662_14990 [Ardenticatenaceae bacterium]|nr:hypothetical protein [Ardenticatenaceae bacterium]